ncbi:hypothetical protein [Isoptericola sp. NPDC019482]|uniref:hypothetical protein n=1 Tax=Isoptericola sp. NPDC019482 TaxID=3154688 RepID=UPI00346AE309
MNMGPVGVELEVLEREPVEPPDPVWEDVAELSVMVGPEGAFVCGPTDPPPEPRLTPNRPSDGALRLRVHARNRDHERDGVATEAHEEYLIQSWPAPVSPSSVLRSGSRFARERRKPLGPPPE